MHTSVNPARSTGPAVLLAVAGDGWGMAQLWLFWFAPIVGAVVGALLVLLAAPEVPDAIASAASSTDGTMRSSPRPVSRSVRPPWGSGHLGG
jgi:hypothetical protein